MILKKECLAILKQYIGETKRRLQYRFNESLTNKLTVLNQVNCKERTTYTNSSEVKPDLCEDQDQQCSIKYTSTLRMRTAISPGQFVVVFYINLPRHRSAIKADPPSQSRPWENCRAVPSHQHSRPQRPRSFWSAPKIATSSQVQHQKSAIHGLPVTLCMLRVKPDKSDWFWCQSIVFTNPFKTGMSLDLARGRYS